MSTVLTKNFSIAEFAQPARHGLPRVPYPEEWIEERLMPLCLALEMIRAEVGAPIRILSGFRTVDYNVAVGGARASQHVQGRAADIVVSGMPAAKVHARILGLHKDGLLSIGGLGLYVAGKFVHVDVRPGKRLARWIGSRATS